MQSRKGWDLEQKSWCGSQQIIAANIIPKDLGLPLVNQEQNNEKFIGESYILISKTPKASLSSKGLTSLLI